MRFLPLGPKLHAYLVAHGTRETRAQRLLRAATRGMRGAGMQVAPDQAQLMQLLARLLGARRCIEIGTYTGYSALALALALPAGGRIVCCDLSKEWTDVARRYWRKAGVAKKIDLRLAPALETLDVLLKRGGAGKYDLAFIDADKTSYDNYYERCLRLLRRGGLIMVDNTLWGGSVIDRKNQTADTRAIRAFNRKLHRDRRVELALVPVGDGLTLARKR